MSEIAGVPFPSESLPHPNRRCCFAQLSRPQLAMCLQGRQIVCLQGHTPEMSQLQSLAFECHRRCLELPMIAQLSLYVSRSVMLSHAWNHLQESTMAVTTQTSMPFQTKSTMVVSMQTTCQPKLHVQTIMKAMPTVSFHFRRC